MNFKEQRYATLGFIILCLFLIGQSTRPATVAPNVPPPCNSDDDCTMRPNGVCLRYENSSDMLEKLEKMGYSTVEEMQAKLLDDWELIDVYDSTNKYSCAYPINHSSVPPLPECIKDSDCGKCGICIEGRCADTGIGWCESTQSCELVWECPASPISLNTILLVLLGFTVLFALMIFRRASIL